MLEASLAARYSAAHIHQHEKLEVVPSCPPCHRENSMKWTPGGTSQDVEDRRDEGGGGGGFQFGGMHLGIGGALILLVLSLVFKQNFFALLGNGGAGPSSPAMSKPNAARDQQEQPLVQFVSFVLDDAQ